MCTKCTCAKCNPPTLHECDVCGRSFPYLYYKDKCRTCGTQVAMMSQLADEVEEMIDDKIGNVHSNPHSRPRHRDPDMEQQFNWRYGCDSD